MTNTDDLTFVSQYFTKEDLAKLELLLANSDLTILEILKSNNTNISHKLANYLNNIIADKIAIVTKEKDEFYGKKLTEQEIQEDAFYNNSPCGYFSTSSNGIINKINDTLLNWLGYTREDIIGKITWQSMLSVGGKMYFETHYSPLLQMQGFVQEISFEMIKKDKTRIPVLINTKQIKDENGKVLINYSTLFDVSQRKSYEKELLIAKRTAEEQTRLFNDANEELLSTGEELRQNLEELISIQEQLQMQHDLLATKNKDIADSIVYASRIQQSIFPLQEEFKAVTKDFFVFFQPKDIVSGDFYYLQKYENKIVISAIDCTGHGVPGALMTMLGNEALNEIIQMRGITTSNIILDELHKNVRKTLKQQETNNHDGMDLSLIVIDNDKKQVQFSGAKNPLIYIQNNQLFKIRGDKMPIGGEQKEEERTFEAHIIPLIESEKNIFYLFSDGFQDQFGGKNGKKFMAKKLKELLLEIHQKDMPTQKEILQNTINEWMNEANEKQIDDILIIGIMI